MLRIQVSCFSIKHCLHQTPLPVLLPRLKPHLASFNILILCNVSLEFHIFLICKIACVPVHAFRSYFVNRFFFLNLSAHKPSAGCLGLLLTWNGKTWVFRQFTLSKEDVFCFLYCNLFLNKIWF